MNAAASPFLPAGPMADPVARWLASQPKGKLRIAREIIRRRKALRAFRGDSWQREHGTQESGLLEGMRLALSYLCDRPGDISQSGAEGFISAVEDADQLVAKAAAEEGNR